MTQARLMRKEKVFIDRLAKEDSKPLYELSPGAARKVLENVQKSTHSRLPDTAAETLEIETVNGRKMKTLLIRPSAGQNNLPVIFYIHGGGWIMGSDTTHERLIKTLAVESKAAVVFPVYENTPENHFTQMTDELFSVLQNIVQNSRQLNLNTNKLVLAGDSVGGNMALTMALMAKNNHFTPQIKFMLLLYPVAVAAFETGSYQEFADGPWLTKKAMEWFWDSYTTDPSERSSIYASSLKASIEELHGLPPTLVITAENDVLRDEGEELARKLDAAGTDTTSVRFNGTIHDFMMLNGLADSAPSQTALLLAAAKLKQIFSTD